jgi:hypothetical protein
MSTAALPGAAKKSAFVVASRQHSVNNYIIQFINSIDILAGFSYGYNPIYI